MSDIYLGVEWKEYYALTNHNPTLPRPHLWEYTELLFNNWVLGWSNISFSLSRVSFDNSKGTSLQRHYAILQALALEEDEMPDMNDETLPDEEGRPRSSVIKALEEFKLRVYGENYDEEIGLASKAKTASTSKASKKRNAIAENAVKEYAKHDWSDLADNGQLKELVVPKLKYYLVAHGLPVGGKKC